DDVSRDWGGKVYEDLLRGVDTILARNRWLDSSRVGAAGGSFGGYMVNWMNGNTSRFAAFASHAGIFNLEHFAGATDELWFPEWEFGGVWWNRTAQTQQYRRWSPHLLAPRMRTPTLVLHGEQDFRVPGPLHGVAAAARAEPVGAFPRRRALDHTAGQPEGVVGRDVPVVRAVAGRGGGTALIRWCESVVGTRGRRGRVVAGA
ncbi:MAG: S9 family peptidase, partial [Gemmatimonadaceae bacterium]|nr:S9 family peptidase [Gemmatimonadaceae bacterium]